ncbi:MAG: GDP-mannose 4,6-dehydratase [Candidatus Eisenbacteria bacterium]
MSTARILITGVGGFVGAHMARRIAERGDVALGVGIDVPPPATERFLTREWRADIRDAEALKAVIGEAAPTAIVHLAGQSSAGLSFGQPLETFRINTLGTSALLEAVRSAAPEARVLVVGSGEVYGSLPAGTRVAEDAPFHPLSPYALSKAVADGIAESYSRQRLDVVRTRSFGHIGPGQTDRFLVPLLARQIAEIEAGRGEDLVRVGNLDVTRDLTDVRDVVEAYLALLERGRSGAVYNVCRGEGTRLADVAHSLCERARVPIRIEVDPARVRPADIVYLVGDPSAIAAETGWKAAIPLDETLDAILEEWRSRSVEKGAS